MIPKRKYKRVIKLLNIVLDILSKDNDGRMFKREEFGDCKSAILKAIKMLKNNYCWWSEK